MINKTFSILLLITTLFFSCNDENAKKYAPKSSGNINSLVVVADNLLWENNVGEEIRNVLAASVEGLSKDEPQFSMSQMPPEVFTGFAKNNRTVLKIEKGKEAGVKIARDAFARPQTLVVVSGQTNSEIIEQIKNNSEKRYSQK